jgi:hypothetical protein
LVHGWVTDVSVVQEDLPIGDLLNEVYAPKQCGLARTRRTNESHDLTTVNLKVHSLEHLSFLKRLVESPNVENLRTQIF